MYTWNEQAVSKFKDAVTQYYRKHTIIYADHIEGSEVALFEKCCELDLEGIVAKYKHAPYDPEKSTWFKIWNRKYSQMVGREELFERERHRGLFRDGTLAL